MIDYLGERLWDTSSAFRSKIIRWINEIQDDVAGELPLDFYEIQMKKLLPTEQSIVELSPSLPGAPTAAISAGGSLVDGTSYKAYVTFLIFDPSNDDYIESEAGEESTAVAADATNKTLSLTAIPTYQGADIEPTKIHRRVYLAKKASSDSEYGEPFFVEDITDNTTTTLDITGEPSSTITPPSDSEVSQITSFHPSFSEGNRILVKMSQNRLKRFDPNSANSSTPNYYDYVGTRKLRIYPKLSSDATTNQRTLSYSVYRRPHEVFYDSSRKIDLPIEFRKALIEGVVWKSYEFRDRDGVQSKASNYEQFKKQALRKYKRQKGRPTKIRDVVGDTYGYEV